MPTGRTGSQRFQERYSDSGHFYFSLTQVDNRFALCKECLRFKKGVKIRLRRVYASTQDVERSAVVEYRSVRDLHTRYFDLAVRADGGEYYKYDKSYCPEGSLFPFVRTAASSFVPIDTGCIWLGTRFEHPRIFVDNQVAKWISPYSPGGFPRLDPFRPYSEVIDIFSKLMNQSRYPDLDLE
jgi:hypothetical protein